MDEKSLDGKILSMHEERLTNLRIHLLCLVTNSVLDVLKLIPVPMLDVNFLLPHLGTLIHLANILVKNISLLFKKKPLRKTISQVPIFFLWLLIFMQEI